MASVSRNQIASNNSSLVLILKELLGEDGAGDLYEYLKTIAPEDIYDYMKEMLDLNNPHHADALQEFIVEKTAQIESAAVSSTSNPSSSSSLPNTASHAEGQSSNYSSPPKRNSQKFVPLFKDSDGQHKGPILPGRLQCNCLTKKHKLIGNCLNCGRIVCEQEGSGSCFFCGEIVCTREEREVLNRNSKTSKLLMQKLKKKGSVMNSAAGEEGLPPGRSDEALSSAIAHKNKLLEYDKTSARRTKVIDDEMDYYASEPQKWISPEEREKLKKKEEEMRSIRHASRRNMKQKIQFDFAGRVVIQPMDDRVNVSHAMYSAPSEESSSSKSKENVNTQPSSEPLFGDSTPTFITTKPKALKVNNVEKEEVSNKRQLRLQDPELREMVDEGLCLSMHQPWASLLVKGIKMHEGRTWYSAHRGRLWIASTAKAPLQEDIQQTRQFYLTNGASKANFPEHYPTSSLLGCVDVIDCLPQEVYLTQYPGGESGSPYVFICENPMELKIKFPISGRHKIYKLDKLIHDAAKKGICL